MSRPAPAILRFTARHAGRLLQGRASLGCAAVVLAIQALVAGAGGLDAHAGWFETLGLSRAGFLSGKIWQIVSYGLLHGSWWHAGLNALWVLVIGARIERMAGRPAMLRAVLAGVVGGALGHLLLGSGLLVGLSGGGVALLLLLTTLSPQSRMLPLPVSGRSLGLGVLIAELGMALMDPAAGLPGFSGAGRLLVDCGMGAWFHIGHACHFGGALAGWGYGRWWLRARVSLEELRRDRSRREGK